MVKARGGMGYGRPWRDSTMRQREEAQRRARAGGGGGGSSNVDVYPVHMGGKKYWPPGGLPMPSAQKEGETHLPGKEFYQATTCVLVGSYQEAYGHRISRVADPSVLPRMLRYRYDKNSIAAMNSFYKCTLDLDATVTEHASGLDALGDGWTPSEEWAQVDGSNGYYFGSGVFTAEVVPSTVHEGAWDVLCPPAHRYPDPAFSGPFEYMEEAMWYAESLVLQARSCGFCAHFAMDMNNGVKFKERAVGGARRDVFIPVFSLRWMFAQDKPNDSSKSADDQPAGYFRIDREAPGTVPEGTDKAVREGFGFFRTTPNKSSKSSRWRTFENYGAHVANVSTICTACLEDGAKRDKRASEITVNALLCPECEKDLVNPKLLVHAQLHRAPDLNDDGSPKWETAGVFQLVNEMACTCPHCNAEDVFGVPVLSCSTCADPTPMYPHECITQVGEDADGGYLTFNLQVDPSTGRVHWPDWSALPLVTGGPVTDRDKKSLLPDTVEGVLRPAIDLAVRGELTTLFNCPDSEEYATLTPRQQAALIGSPVFGDAVRHAERR